MAAGDQPQIVVVQCLGCYSYMQTTLPDTRTNCSSCNTMFATEPLPLFGRIPAHSHGILPDGNGGWRVTPMNNRMW